MKLDCKLENACMCLQGCRYPRHSLFLSEDIR